MVPQVHTLPVQPNAGQIGSVSFKPMMNTPTESAASAIPAITASFQRNSWLAALARTIKMTVESASPTRLHDLSEQHDAAQNDQRRAPFPSRNRRALQLAGARSGEDRAEQDQQNAEYRAGSSPAPCALPNRSCIWIRG